MSTLDTEFQALVANLSGTARSLTFQGRDFVAAPITLLVPGVLPGSKGPILYEDMDVTSNYQAWNFMPILYNHPEDGGSGRRPEVVEECGIGFVFNAGCDDNKLKADGWFDVEKCNNLDERIVPNVLNGSKLEVSTGLFIDIEHSEGVHNGHSYIGVARHYRPDHLALLMDDPGACSVEDGCGVNNKKNNTESAENPTSLLTKLARLLGIANNEASHSDLHNQLRVLLLDKYGGGPQRYDLWIEDTYSDRVVFSLDGKFWEIGYSTDSNGVASLDSGEAAAVIKTTEYKPAPTSNIETKETDMSELNKDQRKELVDSIITNCGCSWKEDDRETLNALDDKVLKSIQHLIENNSKAKENEALVEAARKGFQAGNDHYILNEKGEFVRKEVKKEEPVSNGVKTSISFEDLPKELQEDIVFARNAKEQRKTELVAKLVANHSEETKQERAAVLNKLSLSELEDRVKDLPPAKVDNSRETNYPSFVGAAIPIENAKSSTAPTEDEMLGVPVWNFDSK